MILVYIAGPFRGPTQHDIEGNVRRAEVAAREMVEAGLFPVTPHSIGRVFHGIGDDRFWLLGTLALMRKCDAVFMLEGWQGSQGATGERDAAKAAGQPVFEAMTDLLFWVRGERFDARGG